MAVTVATGAVVVAEGPVAVAVQAGRAGPDQDVEVRAAVAAGQVVVAVLAAVVADAAVQVGEAVGADALP